DAVDVHVGQPGDVGLDLDARRAVGVGQEVEPGGGGEGVVAGAALVRVGGAGTVQGLDAGDVVAAQSGARALVGCVEGGGGVGAVVEAEGVGGLMQHGGEQVVGAAGAADVEGVTGVQHNVAGPGAGDALEGAGGGQLARGLGGAGDADVAEVGVALGQAGGAEGLAAVGHQPDVDIGLDGPGLEGAQHLALPGGGGG